MSVDPQTSPPLVHQTSNMTTPMGASRCKNLGFTYAQLLHLYCIILKRAITESFYSLSIHHPWQKRNKTLRKDTITKRQPSYRLNCSVNDNYTALNCRSMILVENPS